METSADADRVRANTAAEINWRIDRQIEENVRRYTNRPKEEIARRIWELEQEWDIERVLQLLASTISVTGIFLSVGRDRRWIILPGLVLSFLFLHVVQGWCPPVPVLRRSLDALISCCPIYYSSHFPSAARFRFTKIIFHQPLFRDDSGEDHWRFANMRELLASC